MLSVGSLIVAAVSVGGFAREYVPEGSQGTVTSTHPLRARFVLDGRRTVEIPLYDGEWR